MDWDGEVVLEGAIEESMCDIKYLALGRDKFAAARSSGKDSSGATRNDGE